MDLELYLQVSCVIPWDLVACFIVEFMLCRQTSAIKIHAGKVNFIVIICIVKSVNPIIIYHLM